MRIAYLCFDDGIKIGGHKGSEVHVVNIASALARIGHEVIVLATSEEANATQYDFDLSILEHGRIARWALNFLSQIKFLNKFEKDLRILIKLIDYRFRAFPILNKFKPEFLIERSSLFSIDGIKIAKRFNLPIALEVNAPLALEARQWRNLILVKIASYLERKAFRSADIIFTVSNELNKYVSNIACTSDFVVTLPNGVDTVLFNPENSPIPLRDRYKIPSDGIVIGYVGGFKKWQDLQTLIYAFHRIIQKHDKIFLLLVGYGETHKDCDDLIHSYNLDNRVIFTGAVPPNQVPDHIAAMDIAVAPFILLDFFYFSPLKIFEYMAAGKCIITSRVGQIEEIIQHEKSGWLYDPGDIEGMIYGLETLLKFPELRVNFGLQARDWVVENHTWERNAQIITEHLFRYDKKQ
jgi:glycosyltransferase involved in cell wall biosynthesis